MNPKLGVTESKPQPIAPNAIHRVISGIRSSPVPAPVLYLALAGTIVMLEVAVKIVDGTFPDGFRLIHIMLPVYAMAVLPAVDSFTRTAERAIDAARPLLAGETEAFDDYRYRLTHLPGGPTVLAAMAGVAALLLLSILQPNDTFDTLAIMTSPITSGVEWTLQFLTWSGVGIVTYLIVRQMMLVHEITTRHTRIELFALGPIYAFSRLTAAHALFTAGVVLIASLALSRLAGTVQWAAVGGSALLLAGATFVVPLLGVRRLIADEKRARLDRVGHQLNGLIDGLETRIRGDQLVGIGDVKDAIDATVTSQARIAHISTWPWQPDTLRGVVSALLAPLVIWLLTRVLETLLG